MRIVESCYQGSRMVQISPSPRTVSKLDWHCLPGLRHNLHMSLISRRSLLGAAAAGSVLTFSGRDLGAAPSVDEGGFKLGVASYSLRKFPRAEAIKIIQRLGLKYVNIKSYHLPLDSTPDQIREARKEFEDAGLHIVGGGNIDFHKDDEADIRHKFEYARLAGMPLIVCAPTKITGK